MIALTLTMNAAQAGFFDRVAIIERLDKIELRALREAGKLIRILALRSMPKAQDARNKRGRTVRQHAAPGQPPLSHSGRLKRFLFYSYDATSRSVVVGPAQLGDSRVPGILEYGGTTTVKCRGFRRTGKTLQRSVAPHPYMGPALRQAQPRIATFWSKAVA